MKLKIYYTGDLHWNVGSFAYIASVLKSEREKFLLLDAGDSVSTQNQGLDSIISMNLLNYDAMVLGNHELDIAPASLPGSLREAHFTIFNSNLSIGYDGGAVSRIFNLNGFRIAVLGVCFPGILSGQPEYPEYTFSDPEATLTANLPKLKAESDFLVLLSHLGFPADQQVAEAHPEIDLILGGHTHTVIKDDYYSGHTMICHSGGEGKYLGCVELEINGSGKAAARKHGLIELSAQVPDLVFREKLGQEKIRLGIEGVTEVLGESLSDFITEKYSGETAFGDFVADLIRFSLAADIVFLNASCINPILGRGTVTRELLEKIIYWDNELYSGTLPGDEIFRLFSKMISNFVEDPYFFCYFSGVRIEYTDDPICRRVFQNLERLEKAAPQSISIKCSTGDPAVLCDLCQKMESPACLRKEPYTSCSAERIAIFIDGNPLMAESFYSIVTTSFLIKGGLAHKYSSFFESYPFLKVETGMKELILKYFNQNGHLRYVKDYRLVVKKAVHEEYGR
ncbi:MAG: 5'-nucleotidase C-terminal domain-containing protein [Candidatus Wallbacteria bacterium]|nr:5'-nucleotidase C-terminal domain-containing protein [Candidatus Wallbacteria bacterium]